VNKEHLTGFDVLVKLVLISPVTGHFESYYISIGETRADGARAEALGYTNRFKNL